MYNKLYKLKWDVTTLWEGCILASIAHALMMAIAPELSHENYWDGINYCLQNSEGSRGTITFKDNICIAAFRDDNIVDWEKMSNNTVNQYFQKAPYEILHLAKEETLQYLLETINGQVEPIITSVFWGDHKGLYSPFNHKNMMENGAVLIKNHIMDISVAMELWKTEWDMTDKQAYLLKKIYMRKISMPKEKFLISKDELKIVGLDDEEGLNISQESFKEIGIQLI